MIKFKHLTLFAVSSIMFYSAVFAQKSDSKKAEKFDATIESLQNYQCPEWFRDAKLGIYMHWGAYSVAEMGEW